MRRSIFLYLFVFAALLVLFQYVSAKRMLDSKNEEIKTLKENFKEATLNIDSLSASSEVFSLASNEEAISYFENRGYDAAKVAQRLKDEIISRNKASEDNDLVPYEGMEGIMRINKIEVLNHKWAIAGFTDGTYWGELLISYSIDDENNLIVETENALLYPN